uniref:FAD-dependent oxidoreductase domain-containing protein 1 n=1 Tax=Myxine glutinosa TaxID=7769 RepID=UPI00358DEBB4
MLSAMQVLSKPRTQLATSRRVFMGTRRTPGPEHESDRVGSSVTTGLMKLQSRIRDKVLALDPSSQWHDLVSERKPKMSAAKEPPQQADVVIIGGGVMGWGVAYWLLSHFKGPSPMSVLVLEKDARVEMGATARSVGGFRQQFSRPENVQMSLYMAEFLRDAKKLLHVPGSTVDLGVRQGSYLFLADEDSAATLEREFHMQVAEGAKLDLLSPWQLSERFPWLNVDGVALGRLGLQNEGWFDPWSLHQAFRRKATYLGADFMHAEFKSFQMAKHKDSMDQVSGKRVSGVKVWIPGTACEYEVKCAVAVNAAGPWGGLVGKRAGLPFDHLPVELRKRYVYSFHSNVSPVMDCPMLVNTDGTYVRPENFTGMYLCGRSPRHEDEPPTDDLEVDHNYFTEEVWPSLGHRVPAFLDLKVKQSWAGFYDCNVIDGSPIIGYHHPLVPNLASICGFSGHGIQHCAAASRGLAEMMLSGHFTTIDLSCFAPSDSRLVEEECLV